MPLDVARSLSISDLLCVLNEKLRLECNGLREYHPPPALSTTSLETEIKSLETRAQDLLSLIPSLRNLLQPINRLPSEILSRIAQILLRDDGAVDTTLIVPLTHVCRYWRASIASDPANWTLVSNLRKGLMALTLVRAKATRLQVTLVHRNDLAYFRIPAPYIQNIGVLRLINHTSVEGLRQALPGFPQSTPNLRSLKLSSAAIAVWDGPVDPFETLTLTLRRLSLVGIPLYPSILRLRSLTEFTYQSVEFDLSLDTLLDFLEENSSLRYVTLTTVFREDSLHRSRHRTPTRNQLRRLSIICQHAMGARALISGIGLQTGARLDIIDCVRATLNDVLSSVSPTHLLNLRPPTLVEYRSCPRKIRLIGPNGELSLRNQHILGGGHPFVEFPLLSLSHIQKFRLVHRMPKNVRHTLQPIVFDQSSFPALEILAVDCETSISLLLSALFSNPSSPPSLKTLAFLNCDLDEVFMEKLTRYASERKGTSSARLHQVVIVNSDGVFPDIASIRKLGRRVPVVDVKVGTELPTDFLIISQKCTEYCVRPMY